jgi:hypothetical protein
MASIDIECACVTPVLLRMRIDSFLFTSVFGTCAFVDTPPNLTIKYRGFPIMDHKYRHVLISRLLSLTMYLISSTEQILNLA